jgi:hypothetical protein
MPKAVLVLLIALVATAAAVVGVLLNRSPDEPDHDEPAYVSIPLTDYDTAGVAVTRNTFCEAVPDEAVAEALGTKPESATSYANGDRAQVGVGLRDVAHEFGCGWAAQGATVRAWVFAPPVTPHSARELARAARAEDACEPIADAPDFGKPSAALVCDGGKRPMASYRGLFGDAWLVCTVTAEAGVARAELTDRVGRWCVAVVEAARA